MKKTLDSARERDIIRAEGQMKSLIIPYPRVSTDEQGERGFSLPTQLEGMEEAAPHFGIEFYRDESFIEDYTGRVPIEQRPAGARLVAALEAGKAQGIMVYRLNRLARISRLMVNTVYQFLERGWLVYDVETGQVTSESDLTFIIRAWTVEQDYKEIREKTTRGRNGKAQAGLVVGMGDPPYGYRFRLESAAGSFRTRVVGLDIYEPEAQVVRQIFNWVCYGEDGHKHLTAFGIAGRLNDLGIPTAKSRFPNSKTSGLWSQPTVRNIVRSTTYRGVWTFGKSRNKNGKPQKGDEAEQIRVPVPPIISDELWYLAQSQVEANKQYSRRNSKNEYLLRGMAHCACGLPMYGFQRPLAQQRPTFYYHCASRASGGSTQKIHNRTCQEKSVRAEKLEEAAWLYAREVVLNHRRFREALELALETAAKSASPKRSELDKLRKDLAADQEEIGIIVQQVRRYKGEAQVKAEEDLEELSVRVENRKHRIRDLEIELFGAELTSDKAMRALEMQKRIVAALEHDPPAKRRVILEMLRLDAKIQCGHFWFRCRLQVSGAIEIKASTSLNTNQLIYYLVWDSPMLPIDRFNTDDVPPPRIWVEGQNCDKKRRQPTAKLT